jgi:hypothetical protein
MSFKKNNYVVIRKAITKDLAAFLANYFFIKKQVYNTCSSARYISPFERFLGYYESEKDQIPGAYASYSDIAMETLMLKCQSIMEKTTDLGGDDWPIYLEPSGLNGKKGVKINLKQGDMLVYKGCELEHWREKFKGDECIQVFLHYNNSRTPGSKKNMFDQRPHLGLPDWFKGFKFT